MAWAPAPWPLAATRPLHCSTCWNSLATVRAGVSRPFDQRMLARALKDSLGYRLQHHFFDVADMAPMLNPDTVLREASLDD